MRSTLSDDDFIYKYLPKKSNKVTFLLLHGTGGDENDLIPLAEMISEDTSILSPRGKVLENGMPRYFRRLEEGVFDLEDLKFRTDELADFLERMTKKYDIETLVALGYSNGANIGASLLLQRPKSLEGAMLFRVMVPFEPEKLPILKEKRVLMSCGNRDPLIPQIMSRKLHEMFEKSGAQIRMNWVNAGHGLVQGDIESAREWFHSNFGEYTSREMNRH